MPNEKLIAALPLAALFAALCHMPPASAAAQDPGMVVVRDPQTGQLRAPTPAELQALRPPPAVAPRAAARPALVTSPDGSRHLRMGEQGMVYSVVTRAGDGKLAGQCVQGEDAAEAVVKQSAAGHNQERGHETR
jgi:hypothetical protein